MPGGNGTEVFRVGAAGVFRLPGKEGVLKGIQPKRACSAACRPRLPRRRRPHPRGPGWRGAERGTFGRSCLSGVHGRHGTEERTSHVPAGRTPVASDSRCLRGRCPAVGGRGGLVGRVSSRESADVGLRSAAGGLYGPAHDHLLLAVPSPDYPQPPAPPQCRVSPGGHPTPCVIGRAGAEPASRRVIARARPKLRAPSTRGGTCPDCVACAWAGEQGAADEGPSASGPACGLAAPEMPEHLGGHRLTRLFQPGLK